ncbi:MAG: SAM-dependent methyltransferase [candidate division KSB1 bacterium]|nr:SAM-dependent methyltransferase [candidate division KSB1 bacterium]MDZ7302948.1 SAM-dependent methyltransferase [candidate division KSB1 bacterium]MDZ7312224.1 SAM-dependent methyltransferase [candidate division KSB1 bacterium]
MSLMITDTMPTNFSFPHRQKSFQRPTKLLAFLHDSIHFIVDALKSHPEAYEKWLASTTSLYGDIFARPRLRQHAEDYALRWQFVASPAELVFALQTIYSFLARAVVVQRLLPQSKASEFIRLLADNGFYRQNFGVRDFLPALGDEEIIAQLATVKSTAVPLIELSKLLADNVANGGWHNTLADLYQTILPRPIRHDLGEYFTPYWLARQAMQMAGFDGGKDKIVLDPGCGSGSFLLAAAEMKLLNATPDVIPKEAFYNQSEQLPLQKDYHENAVARASSLHADKMSALHFHHDGCATVHDNSSGMTFLYELLCTVIGCDLNPLSVLSARLNYLWFLATHFGLPLPEVDLPILHFDSVFRTALGNTSPDALQKYLPEEGCDYLVGNPPWINWNCLPSAYRAKLEKELLPQYGLFDFHGQEARLGHSNDDYLSTFALVTIHRYLRQSGICSFVIKQPLLSNVAGKTFRRLEIRHISGMTPLRVIKVADLRPLNPFGIANETALIVLQKGAQTEFPVVYESWSRKNGHVATTSQMAQPSRPADFSSPWIVLSNDWQQTQLMEGHNPYPIRHGLKHDAAEILIMEVLEQRDGLVCVQRTTGADRQIYQVEPALIYPFLQPRHVRAWGLDGYGYLILPQRKAGEDNETEIINNFPLTYAYLKSFENTFLARRSKVFTGTPFYGLFGLGEYTFARYKICWVGLGFQPKFVVAEEIDDALVGCKAAVPDGTIYFIPCHDRDEAHFICALLNSTLVCKFFSARSGKSKRGLSKKVVEQLALPKFHRHNERHVYLANVSLQLHQAFGQPAATELIPKDFEKVVMEVFQTQKNSLNQAPALSHMRILARS